MITYILIYIALIAFGFYMAKEYEDPTMFWASLIPVANLILPIITIAAAIGESIMFVNAWFEGKK
jgi:uncharacterized membrane protein